MGGSFQGIAGLMTSYFPLLKIDTYQRSSTWKGPQKASFIISVLNDWPTGIVVLNKIEAKGGPRQLAASYDIIDGQQRLTALYEFLNNPLIYVYLWAQKEMKDEPQELSDLRDSFIDLVKELKKKGSGYLPVQTSTVVVKQKVYEDVQDELARMLLTGKIVNPVFTDLINNVVDVFRKVGQRSIAVQELNDTGTAEAEKMYLAINTSGKPVLWWELLKAGDFNKTEYRGDASYTVKYTNEIKYIANLYYSKNKIPPKDRPSQPTIWDALFAVGEYYHYLLSQKIKPSEITLQHTLTDDSLRKIKVDGLGFRLVTGFLTHEISRARINKLMDEYDPVTICKTIDILIDTASILISNCGKFRLFFKYRDFGSGVIPAYPLLCLLLASAKMVAINSINVQITDRQRDVLRILSEELLRESICTSKWSGSGDSKLKEWLEKYFTSPSPTKAVTPGITHQVVFPGTVGTISSTYSESVWLDFINRATPVQSRSVPKEWQYFYFVTQYLLDSKIPGTLPAGEIEFDHLVPYNKSVPETSHPFNFAAITSILNGKKGGRTYCTWSPNGSEKMEYWLYTFNNQSVMIGSDLLPAVDFLAFADNVKISRLINARKGVLEYAFKILLPNWIANGD